MASRIFKISAALICGLSATAASAQTPATQAPATTNPFNGTLQCAAASPNYLVDIGDFDGHQAVLQKFLCTVTQAFVLASDKPVQDSAVISGDLRGNKLTGNGTNVITMENGDLAVYSFRVSVTMSGGVAKSSEGTFQWIGGTGALKGITGKGTVTGTYAADGSVTVRIQGDYTIAPAAEQP